MSQSQISVDDLIKISRRLVGTYFKDHDFYSLLVLSLITVTQYSRKKRHLRSNQRIDLACAFVPDLIDSLNHNGIITPTTAERLRYDFRTRSDDIPKILRAYIYVSGGLRTKMDPEASSSQKTSCAVQ